MPPKARSILERFNEKVGPRTEFGCREWTASTGSHGYGQMTVKRDGKKTVETAHRLAWELFRGPIPAGLIVRHTCDNRRCVNPNHLLIGTQQDNVDDMYRRDRARSSRGEDRNDARLTDAKVVEIRQRASGGESSRALGAVFKVSHTTILKIVRREKWSHVP